MWQRPFNIARWTATVGSDEWTVFCWRNETTNFAISRLQKIVTQSSVKRIPPMTRNPLFNMKPFFLYLCLLGVMSTAFGQTKKSDPPVPGEKIYLDAKMEEVKKKQAVFFQKAEMDGDKGWLVMVYFNNGGQLKMRGHYIDDALEVPHGTFSYYYQNGQLESQGKFENGAKIGVWERFNPNGSAKAERYYSGYKYGDDPILDPDVMPEYEGGYEAMYNYLSENLEYPEVALINKVEGEVYVSFVVNKVGEVERVMVMNSLDPHLDQEAIRLVENMPNWKPGSKEGKLVKTQMVMPINFKLN